MSNRMTYILMMTAVNMAIITLVIAFIACPDPLTIPGRILFMILVVIEYNYFLSLLREIHKYNIWKSKRNKRG